MTVKELIEELNKLPPQAQLQDVRVYSRYRDHDVSRVSFQGNHTKLETE